MNITYKHSGKFTSAGLAIAIVTGLAAGLPLAYLYAWGIIQISEQKMAVLATLAYGASVRVAAGFGMKLGKVRNSKIASALGVAVAAVSLYCCWAFWTKNIILTFQNEDLSALSLMKHPRALWEVVKLINQNGTWGLSEGDVTKGAELWAIWVGEVLTVLYASAMAARAFLELQPFCEKCQIWCSSTDKLTIGPGDPMQIKRSMATRDLTFLEKLGSGNKKTGHLAAKLHSCSSCGDVNTLTLMQTIVIQPTRWWQRPSIRKEEVAKKFVLSRAEADAFRNTAHNVKQLSQAVHV